MTPTPDRPIDVQGAAYHGATPRRRRLLLTGVAVSLAAVIALVVAALAPAAKEVIASFGSASAGGAAGEFSTPRGVAAHGPSGKIYVVDASNHRIQRFSADGTFERAWGRGVDDGTPAAQICTSDCQAGTTGSGEGMFDDPQGIAVDQTTGDVYVRDRDNRRVQQFDADGAFVRAWGFGVDTGAAVFEVCTTNCLQGLAGAGIGQFGSSSTSGGGGIAISPADGDVYVADPGNRRVLRFAADGTLDPSPVIGSAGTGAGQFASNMPQHVAVDSAGVLYASDTNASGRINRFDAAGTAMDPIAAPPLFPSTSTAGTSGLQLDPDSDGPGPDDDILYVLRDPASPTTAETVVQQYGPINAPGEATPPAAVDDTHGEGAGFLLVNGLGLDSTAGRLFVTTSSGDSGHRVYVLDDATPPTAAIEPPTAIGPRGATFHGEVDANGVATGYRFEYAKQGSSDWTAFPSDFVDAGAGSGPVPVSDTVVGVLEPNTQYQVRLIAKRNLSPASDISAAATFTTAQAPPTVAPFASADPGTGAARLYGRVTPNGQPTTYRFEWGPTAAYGNTTPPIDAGSGGASVLAKAAIDGLQPNSTYHFRLVATNDSGTTEGADQQFTTARTAATSCANEEYRTGPAARLPDCRAYEQVSPPDKNGFDIQSTGEFAAGADPAEAGGAVAAASPAVAYRSEGAFADAAFGGNFRQFYVARLDDGRWRTNTVFPRLVPTFGVGAYQVAGFNQRMTAAVLVSNNFTLADPAGQQESSIYRHDLVAGATSLLATMPAFAAPASRSAAVSDDLARGVFTTSTTLTAEPAPPDGMRRVYGWSPDGVQLMAREPDSDDPIMDRTFHDAGFAPASGESAEQVISTDGESAFFMRALTNAGIPIAIYRRKGGVTRVGSPARRTPPDLDTDRRVGYQAATPDGRYVFFATSRKLTDDANEYPGVTDLGDLYRYDFAADRLTNLSAGTPGSSPAEARLVGMSEDGSRVYFAATGELVPGVGDSGAKLYFWEDDGTAAGAVRHVATLGGSVAGTPVATSEDDRLNWDFRNFKRSAVSEDGRHLVFRTSTDLDGPGGSDPGGGAQIYLYDADADDGAGDLVCVSCPPDGVASGPALVPTQENGFQKERPRFLSSDGRRVFFTSPDALVSDDGNGKLDAYVWQRSSGPGGELAGEVSLLSTGTSGSDSYFHAADADGDLAFFRTRERLVPQDGDTLADLYVARVGGGLASQQRSSQPRCQGDDCQGPATTPPTPADRASERFSGRGNISPAVRSRLRLAKVSRRQRVRLARGQRVALRVRAPGAVRVRIVGRATVGGRKRIVARGAVRARRAGMVRVRLRLSPRARRHLRVQRRLRVALTAQAPDSVRVRTVLTLRWPR